MNSYGRSGFQNSSEMSQKFEFSSPSSSKLGENSTFSSISSISKPKNVKSRKYSNTRLMGSLETRKIDMGSNPFRPVLDSVTGGSSRLDGDAHLKFNVMNKVENVGSELDDELKKLRIENPSNRDIGSKGVDNGLPFEVPLELERLSLGGSCTVASDVSRTGDGSRDRGSVGWCNATSLEAKLPVDLTRLSIRDDGEAGGRYFTSSRPSNDDFVFGSSRTKINNADPVVDSTLPDKIRSLKIGDPVISNGTQEVMNANVDQAFVSGSTKAVSCSSVVVDNMVLDEMEKLNITGPSEGSIDNAQSQRNSTYGGAGKDDWRKLNYSENVSDASQVPDHNKSGLSGESVPLNFNFPSGDFHFQAVRGEYQMPCSNETEKREGFSFTGKQEGTRMPNVEFRTLEPKGILFTGSNMNLEFCSKKGSMSRGRKGKVKESNPVFVSLAKKNSPMETSVQHESSNSYSPMDVSPCRETRDDAQSGGEPSLTSNDSVSDEMATETEYMNINESNDLQPGKPNEHVSECCVNADVDSANLVTDCVSTTEDVSFKTALEDLDNDREIEVESKYQVDSSDQTQYFSASSSISSDVSSFTFSASSSHSRPSSATRHNNIKKNQMKVGPDLCSSPRTASLSDATSSLQFPTIPRVSLLPLQVRRNVGVSNAPLEGGINTKIASPTTRSEGFSVFENSKKGITSPIAIARAAQDACEKWRLRGNQAYTHGDLNKAEDYYTQGLSCISRQETSMDCLRSLVLCYSNRAATRMSLGRMRGALGDCLVAAEIDPMFLKVQLRAAKKFCSINPHKNLTVTACSTATVTAVSGTDDGVLYNETIELARVKKVEGKINIRLDQGKDEDNWQLTVRCTLPGKWVLHWGVHYVGVVGSEWDQPPEEIRPPGSIAIKDYAIETPLSQSTATEGGDTSQEVNINFNCSSKIAAINFVLKDEETGSWYQHKGRDFVVPLVDDLRDGDNVVGQKKDIGLWPGSSEQLSSLSLNGGAPQQSAEEIDEASSESPLSNKPLEGFDVDLPIVKEVPVCNSLSVSVRKCPDTSRNLVHMETDLPGNVLVHWGVCFDKSKIWALPETPHPPETEVFKNKALRTQLQIKEDGSGAKGLFSLNEDVSGFPFVLKLDDDTWLNNKGNDFFIPLSGPRKDETTSEDIAKKDDSGLLSGSVGTDEKPTTSTPEPSDATYTDEIIKDIRTLVTGISSEKKWKTKTKEAQEGILQEIEKLAAEAYSIFRSSSVTFSEESILEIEAAIEAPVIRSGTGSGFEILCQGFNWESHKSGKWYLELQQQAAELSSLGFTVVWFPPPTESVSPEGYMPKDLYNLNSRYGTIDELKEAVKQFHKVGIKVLGDAVLNHRCAHSKNGNGIWNIFGGRLNWDDRAVVADDPHFQGRGNKSSGDNFHAAPNIDHSQDFVRNDIKEWLCWLREDIGYDGWRLDFVRGFWGGYVKDYIDASTPYFAVGEYWDSLSYSYGEMDYDQDAHRQRIVDWINATGGTAGAFDVTTKGILHAALERCEYWRLTDSKGKPPGVVGWWPSRAITFIENHDTGSTQGHWRFPGGKEMQGYAYILTHPGTPSVFYDHVFHYKKEIAALLALRNRKKISCRSTIKITKADRDVYAAVIDDKVAMKIGPGHYEPPSESQKWSVAIEGNDYKVWETV